MDHKIAIITDIHGNYSAVKAVLNDIDRDGKIEHIYCLGDLVGIGYETNEVLQLLCSRKDISFVMGNHDEAILDIIAGREPYSRGKERVHHYWIADHLDRKFIPFLKELPVTLDSIYHTKRLFFVHYHLSEQNVFISVDKEPTEDKLDKLYETSNADIVCFGHHHVIHHFKSKERLYLNPSSLGCNHRPFANYGVVNIGAQGDISVAFREVPYDNKEFLLGFKQRDVPEADYILKIFYGDQHLKYM